MCAVKTGSRRPWRTARTRGWRREVEDEGRARLEVGRDDRPEFPAAFCEPFFDRDDERAGFEAARSAENVVGEAGLDATELAQELPGRGFADAEIIVVALAGVLLGGDRDTQAQAHDREGEKGGDLVLGERAGLVKAGDDGGRGLERVVLAIMT